MPAAGGMTVAADGYRWDAKHHHFASWDGHSACKACLRKVGMCSHADVKQKRGLRDVQQYVRCML